ncbi:hypothetical protein [Flavobacterium sp. UMI-01]|uniref:hypothetical protein n=1 Tax=Flavobacterium sp. UMI-01 TaxID=1441053 RepID=UPI001C7DBD85|nr:hypothetical protein [Flavobacterium sp. UMI-01]GIZ09275.1 hypothetical protein FUMI01_20020 [Flavobacterium sp. UMI-01]
MKKRLEADLISIAHRILQLKNKSDINQLFLETQKLYEKLAVLRFVEEQYGDIKPTIGQEAILTDVANFFDTPKEPVIPPAMIEEEKTEDRLEINTPIAEATLVTPEILTPIEDKTESIEEEKIEIEDNNEELLTQEPIQEIVSEKVEEAAAEEEIIQEEVAVEEKTAPITPPAFIPSFSLTEEVEEDKIEVETSKKNEAIQISFEDLLGGQYNEPQFVKVDEIPAIPPTPVFEAVESNTTIEESAPAAKNQTVLEKAAPKVISLNDKFSKGIDIDLNDQIAFVKHLFGNSREDYNRVMSQIMTFDNFYETKAFIEDMVKPDYNDWKGKTDYEERFMEIIEKKFL